MCILARLPPPRKLSSGLVGVADCGCGAEIEGVVITGWRCVGDNRVVGVGEACMGDPVAYG